MIKIFAVLVCQVVAWWGSSGPVEAEKENGVIVLTNENIDAELKKHNGLLVMFYAPWW
jgi:hypothetical protein